MKRLGRWVGVSGVVAALVVSAGGCAFARKKPYAGDPLLGHGRGVWGEFETTRRAEASVAPEPAIPSPPDSPLLGTPLVAVAPTRRATLP